MNLNNVSIMGNLTRDPEMRSLPSGKEVCSLSLANNRFYMKNGEKVSEVSFFDVDVWGITAENCSKYLTKGNGVIVEGRLRVLRLRPVPFIFYRKGIIIQRCHLQKSCLMRGT